jgi:hypothetical protein
MTTDTDKLQDLKDVGFYNLVEREGRSLHVQTEVLWRESIKVKSTVIEGGKILRAVAQPLPESIDNAERGRAFIRAQHDAVLFEVDNGKL